MKKQGRNDLCLCGSGKKFKKCCESIMIGGRFLATKVSSTSAPQVATSPKLTGLFLSRISQIGNPADIVRTISASSSLAPVASENTVPPTE